MMHTNHRLIASASLVALAALLSLGATAPLPSSGPPTPPPPAADPAKVADKMALVKASWDEVNSALSALPAKLSAAFTASVQEEQLKGAKSNEKGGNDWRCESALRTAIDESKAARKEAGALAERAANRWKAAKSTASGCPAAELPWGGSPQDAKQVAEALTRVNALVKGIDSAQSSAGPAALAKIWNKAQEYASKQPKCLPAAQAESIIPQSVQVPCLNTTVRVR
jgi:hypothetical protein